MSNIAKIETSFQNATEIVFWGVNPPVKTLLPVVTLLFPNRAGNAGYLLLKSYYKPNDFKLLLKIENNKINLLLKHKNASETIKVNNLIFDARELATFKTRLLKESSFVFTVGEQSSATSNNIAILAIKESPELFTIEK